MNGKFITFEGPEGSGKTSVIKAIKEFLDKKGESVITTREPGGIRISEKIRDIILDVNHKEMDPRTEALLFAASRRQHIVEKIEPALKDGKIILCDRFLDSSLVYQGIARNLGVDQVFEINRFAIGDIMPNLTIFIDVPPAVGLDRVFSNDRKTNRLDLEDISFHEKLYKGYKDLADRYSDRIKVINGNKELEEVVLEAIGVIEKIL